MKVFSKAVLASLMVAGAAIATAAPASAGVGVSVNLGLFGPPVVVAPPPPPPAYVAPAYCYGAYYYANCGFQIYGDPVFWNGDWYSNAPYRIIRGRREFWVNGGWHEARVRDRDFDRDRDRRDFDRDRHDNGEHRGFDRGDRDRR